MCNSISENFLGRTIQTSVVLKIKARNKCIRYSILSLFLKEFSVQIIGISKILQTNNCIPNKK